MHNAGKTSTKIDILFEFILYEFTTDDTIIIDVISTYISMFKVLKFIAADVFKKKSDFD